jgi:hypothetical protein
VVIGAFAARAFGAPLPPTLEIDFTPASSQENLGRLASALRELSARHARERGIEIVGND